VTVSFWRSALQHVVSELEKYKNTEPKDIAHSDKFYIHTSHSDSIEWVNLSTSGYSALNSER